MLTNRPSIVIATAPRHSRHSKSAKPLNGPRIVQAGKSSEPAPVMHLADNTPPAKPQSAMHLTDTPKRATRIVHAKKPAKTPYLTWNVPKHEPDPEADAKLKAFFRKMMPGHPMND
jgi:hypothetical protein